MNMQCEVCGPNKSEAPTVMCAPCALGIPENDVLYTWDDDFVEMLIWPMWLARNLMIAAAMECSFAAGVLRPFWTPGAGKPMPRTQ